MKNLSIVEENSTGRLFMMEKNDFRLESAKWGYTVIEETVLNLGKYENVKGHDFKARRAHTTNADFYVWSDWSAVEI